MIDQTGEIAMMKKLTLSFLATLIATVAGYAQTPTITNNDLAKYRSERLKAEADLRENYAQLGFPSPDERARRDAESVKATAELASKLRAENLERERIEAAQRAQSQPAPIQIVQTGGREFYWFTGHWRVPRHARRGWVQPGYFAAGAFWPTGNRTRPRPMIVPVRPRD